MCERTCKFDAIHVVDGVARVDYDKCKGCGMCAQVPEEDHSLPAEGRSVSPEARGEACCSGSGQARRSCRSR